jgi:hypothetical protein
MAKTLFLRVKMGIYSLFEDKWYGAVEAIDQFIPVTKVTDRIDSHIPSFLVFLAIVFILILLLFFFSTGTLINGMGTYDAQITVVSKIGLPLSGTTITLRGDCGEENIEQNAVTDEDGKATFEVCNLLQNISLKKTGYVNYNNSVDLEIDKIFKLSPIPTQINSITVLVHDEQDNLLTNSTVNLVCDGNISKYTNPTNSGFLIEIPQFCNITQIRAFAPGFKEKTKTLQDNEERIVIKLEENKPMGKIIFETKTPTTSEANVEIRITDSTNKSFTEMTDASGTKEVTLKIGEYSYVAISKKGEVAKGNFSILSNSTERESILFSDNAIESKKAIYVKIVNLSDSPIINAKVSMFQDGNAISSRNTNSKGEISPITINPDLLSEGTKHTAVIKALGYETTFSDLELVEKSGEPQKIVMNQHGATIHVTHIDDLSKKVKDAFTTLYYNDYNEVFDSGTSDSNGDVLFKNLPAGKYTIKSTYSKTDSYGKETITVDSNSLNDVTIVLITGEGKMRFNFMNQTGTDIDTNYEFYESIDGMLQKTVTGASSKNYYYTNKIKSKTSVMLKTTNPEYFPHETITYQMSRKTQNKDVFLREQTTLPNSEKVQMFLVGMYSTNPTLESFNKASRLSPGNTYYLYFDIILNNETSDYLVGNFKIGDDSFLTESISIENIYSIDGYSRIMTDNSSSFIIDTSNNVVDSNAKQANLILQNQQGKKSIPVFVEIKIDINAPSEEVVPLYFQTTHGTQESLLYNTNLTVGESICLFEYDSDCPAFLVSHYLKRNTSEYVPLKDNHVVLIGDDYTIKSTVKNLTDEEIGSSELKLIVPKEKMNYFTVGADTNAVTHQINLFPFQTTSAKETKLNLIKKTNSGKLNIEVQKEVAGLNALKDYEINEDRISIKIVEKEELEIAIIPNEIHKNVSYPHFFIKTKYKSQYKGTSAIWYVEKNGDRMVPGYEGITDANGEENTFFDATGLEEGDVLTFVAYDLNGNLPAKLDVIVRDPFPPAAVIAPSCLGLKLPNGNLAKDENLPYFELNENASKHITIDSNCTDTRNAYIYTDLYVSENSFSIGAGETKDITVTGKIRDNIYGAYPLQVLEIGSARYNLIEHIDVVVKNSGCFQLNDAIIDFRTNNEVDTIVRNTCFSGRKDNFYPNAHLNTVSASIKYDKPGNPEDYNFTAKVLGHGIESIAYGFIKSDIMYVRETGGRDGDPWSVPTLVGEAEVTDTITDICEDVAYQKESTPKPEPDLPETTPDPTNTYSPSSIVPISGDVGDVIISNGDTNESLTTKEEERIEKVLFSTGTASTIGTGSNAVDGETGPVPLGEITDIDRAQETCPSINGNYGNGIRGLNCGPYHSGSYYMEYIWDIMHDVQGNPTPGAPRPSDFAKYWGAVRDLRGEDYTVLSVQTKNNARIEALAYGGDGITHAKYYVKGDRDLHWDGYEYETSYLKTQVDYSRVVEWASDQIGVWEAEVTINPVEGATYPVGQYDAHPVPLWMDDDTIHGYEENESWNPEGADSLYTVACVVNNGFVNPERMASLESSEPWIIKDPADPLVEYDASGNIMYEIPLDSIPPELNVYLRNGEYFAEYIGLPEIDSPNISFTFSNNSLQGSEYAILKVRDWTGDTVNETAFQVKLVDTNIIVIQKKVLKD